MIVKHKESGAELLARKYAAELEQYLQDQPKTIISWTKYKPTDEVSDETT